MALRSLLVVTLVAVAAPPAGAQSATAEAEILFRKGKALLDDGKIPEACDAFDASQRAEPAVTTQLNQASCRAKNGQLATAWGLFVDAARQTRGAADRERKKLHKVATEHAAKLEPRLSTLTITVPDASRVGGLEVLRDGVAVDAATWNQALPIDGGTYEVTARAPGNADWTTTIEIGVERDAAAIEIPKLKAAALTPVEADVTPTPASPARPRRSWRAPVVVGAVAVVLGGGGIGFALWGDHTYDRSTREPDLDTQRELWRSANRKRYAAQGLGVAAIGGAGVAIWLHLRGGRGTADRAAATTTRVRVEPAVARDAAVIVVRGRF
jgi:hypothetical protein